MTSVTSDCVQIPVNILVILSSQLMNLDLKTLSSGFM